MKSHISVALWMKAVFFGSTHKPRTKGSRDVEARVRACAERQNRRGSGVDRRPLGAVWSTRRTPSNFNAITGQATVHCSSRSTYDRL